LRKAKIARAKLQSPSALVRPVIASEYAATRFDVFEIPFGCAILRAGGFASGEAQLYSSIFVCGRQTNHCSAAPHQETVRF
jgi:hypothetical protein